MKASPSGTAQSFIDLFGNLYAIEKNIRERNLAFDRIVELRKEQALPVLEKIKAKLDHEVHRAAPKSALGKAIQYMLEQ